MPSANQNPAPHQDSDGDDFQDATVHVELQQQQGPDFRALFKRKNAYAKKRITMAENLIKSVESQTNRTFRDNDMEMLTNHLKNADKAVQSVTDVIESATHSLSETDIDSYLNLLDEHSPRLLDVRARINAILDSLPNSSTQQTSNSSHTAPSKHSRVDTAFKPNQLDSHATPAVFHEWRQHFWIYMKRNGLHQADFDEKKLMLYTCLTPRMASTLKRVCMDDDLDSIDQILDALEEHIKGSNNIMTRRYKFFNCLQRPDETLDQYIVRFREIGDYAEFEKLSYNDLMACRLVTGIHNHKLRTDLLRCDKKDFKSIKQFALAWESTRSGSNEMTPSTPTSDAPASDVNKLSTYKSNKKRNFQSSFHPSGRHSSNADAPKPSNKPQDPSRNSSTCPFCGINHQKHNKCQSRRQQCTFCNIFGHHVRVCRKRPKHSSDAKQIQQLSHDSHDSEYQSDAESTKEHVDHVHTLDTYDTEDDDECIFSLQLPHTLQVAAVQRLISQSSKTDLKQKPKLSIKTPKISVTFRYQSRLLGQLRVLPDTGAAVSVLPLSVVQNWNIQSSIIPSDNNLQSVNGTPVHSLGILELRLEMDDVHVDALFFVSDDVRQTILSWHVLKQLGVIPETFPISRFANPKVNNISSDCFLNKQIFIHKYPKVFDNKGKLGQMRGSPMHIFLKDHIDWPSIKQTIKPRPIPVPLRHATKLELDSMQQRGIIKPVSSPTYFTSPLLVVPKKEGKVRLVIDYTELNRHIKRPIHPFPNVNEVRAIIPPNCKFFATLDATQGYWQIPLHEQSQELTTFITPWGRFCYTRAPMGLASSGDEFCRRVDYALRDINNIIKVVDDVLVYAQSKKELVNILNNVLSAASQHGLTLSPDKFVIAQSVSFLGLQISSEGISPDPKHLEAIYKFPTPKNRTDLRSFMGLANQFSSFTKNIASYAKNLRPLLSKDTAWQWEQIHDEAFTALCNTLVKAPILAYFDPRKETKLVTDASKLNGLGFALLQKQDNNRWSLIACGSRFINSTEANYAICELEALAIVWAIRKCKIYLLGLTHFTVETDHRPLMLIFNTSRLTHCDNPRLVRLMHRVSMYIFTVQWVPEKHHHVPDALSRFPISQPTSQDIYAIAADTFQSVADPAIKQLSEKAIICPRYQELVHCVKTMTSYNVKKLPNSTHMHIKLFASLWDRLSVDHETQLVILDNYRIVVPASCRKDILNLAHQSHQGITRTKARLQSIYFWPGISNDIIQLVQTCDACQQFRSSQPAQPLQCPKMPQGPFEAVSCDLFEFRGSHTLTYVDRYSGWPLVAHFTKAPSSLKIIKVLSGFFRDFGIPVSLRHDGAKPLVSSEFTLFLKRNNIQVSSAYNPRSNGHAEASVKAMKLLIKKCFLVRQLDEIQFNQALLEWRNTPRFPGNLSPAEILFGKKLRTLIPVKNYKYLSCSQIRSAVQANFHALTQAYNKFNFRKNSLPKLDVGDTVRIRNTLSRTWNQTGKIVDVRDSGLSYYVRSNNKTYLRNRRLLKKI